MAGRDLHRPPQRRVRRCGRAGRRLGFVSEHPCLWREFLCVREEQTVGNYNTINGAPRASNVTIRRGFQLPTVSVARLTPSAMSVRRVIPRHMTILPGGGSRLRLR